MGTACVARWRALLPAMLLALGLQCPADGLAAGCTLTTVELPVHMVGQRAIATVGINGQDVPMMVDSGAFYSSLTDAAATQLHLNARHDPGLRVYGLTGKVDTRVAVATLKVAKGEVPNAEFVVGGNELGVGAMGILGRNVLAFTDTEYDLAHGLIRFVFPSSECAKANMAYWAGKDPVSEIELFDDPRSRTPAIRARAKLNDMPVDVLFDTGATTLVSHASALRAGVKPGDLKPTGQIHGVGQGSAQAWVTTFGRFEIGGEAIANNRLDVADFRNEDDDMLLGIDFFLSHHIYVSKQQQRMFFTYVGGPVFARNREAAASDAAAVAATSDDQLDADGYARRGEASRARGDIRAALADLDRACALAPQHAQYFDTRAELHALLKQWDATMADYDTALRLDPTLAHARDERAWLRQSEGNLAGARDDIAVLDKTLSQQAELRKDMAGLFIRLHEPARAVAQLDLWIPAHPHDIQLAGAYNSRCWARVLMGAELDQAVADCDQATGLEPSRATYVDSRAWLLMRQGKWQQALAEFDRSLALDKAGASSLYGRGIVRRHLGDAAAAEADLAEARKLRKNIDADMKALGLSADQLALRQP